MLAPGIAAVLAAVSGTIYLIQDGVRRPLAGASVTASWAGSRVASATSDAAGRYRLPNLPPNRITLAASCPGYFLLAPASREAGLVIDLRSAPEYSPADFEARRGGVITGRLTDAWGDPVDRAAVYVTRLSGPGDRHREPAGQTTTDDRGLYRLFGLAPGRYRLAVLPPEREDGEEPAAPIYYPGVLDPARARPLEVAAGEEIGGADVVLRPERLYEVRGRLAEPPPEGARGMRIHIQRVREGPDAPPAGAPVEKDGTFLLPRLPPGPYVLSALGPGERRYGRLRVDVSSDLADVVIGPTPSGRLTGRVVLTGRSAPAEVVLGAVDSSRQGGYTLRARAPDYRLEAADLWPDTYSLEVRWPPGAYLLGDTEIAVPAGGAAEVELRAGLGTGSVRGTVKPPGGGRLPHGRVALVRSESGRLIVRTEQTDQNGRFEFREVRPAGYRICAWPSQDVSALDAGETWDRAGASVKRFAVDPGAEIEIDLTAAR